jgi:hypothetical protein
VIESAPAGATNTNTGRSKDISFFIISPFMVDVAGSGTSGSLLTGGSNSYGTYGKFFFIRHFAPEKIFLLRQVDGR